jgi:hypothetical protein
MDHASHGVGMSWAALMFLGAFHGVNPGMGWLFAVALGMQENRAAAVWRALVPLGVGHAGASAAALAVGVLAGTIVSPAALRWPVALLLIGLGVRRLIRQRHPRWGGMRISMAGLTCWSFLMATAHGAGLMVVPVWLAMGGSADASIASGLTATAVHGASYLLVTAAIAWVVFEKLGVGLLRRAWINLDLVWAAALIATGGMTLFI